MEEYELRNRSSPKSLNIKQGTNNDGPKKYVQYGIYFVIIILFFFKNNFPFSFNIIFFIYKNKYNYFIY